MINNMIQFFDGVKKEFSKVVWPSRQELFEATVVVLVIVAFFALYLGGIDLVFRTVAGKVFNLR